MNRLLKGICLLLSLPLVIGCSSALSESTVKNTQKNGYIEQSIDHGNYESLNYLVTDWSKLKLLPDANEEEQGMYLCLIAADMLEYGMTKEEYFTYLDEKGLKYEFEELFIPIEDGDLPVYFLYFTSRLCLIVQGNPIFYAQITMDSPFEIPDGTSIAVDLNNTSTPYLIMTDDESLIPESEFNTEDIP